MSAEESAGEATVGWRDRLPAFDLDCRFDDPADPREVTVFEPDARDLTAAWISADARHTVPLDRVA